MARTYRFLVGAAEAGFRLDVFLARHLPSALSRAMIQRAIKEGCVTVGGKPLKVGYKVRPADEILAHLEQLPQKGTSTDLIPQDIPLSIVFEDDALLVVNKPPGLVTHPAPGHWSGTLVNAVLWHLGHGTGDRGHADPSTSHVSRPMSQQLPRAGIVHRLDKDTSGLLLIAKTERAHVALSRQLKSRAMKRRYLAFAEGHLPLNTGTVHAPIGRHQVHRKVMTVKHLGGRAATTHYRVMKRMPATEAAPSSLPRECPGARATGPSPALPFPWSVVELSLETGRTHQIRVHLAHLGYPVLGDAVYSRRLAPFWDTLGIARQLLHAYRLTFKHPMTGHELSLTAPLPEDMNRWLDQEARTRIQSLV